MCFLCFQQNPFNNTNSIISNSQAKKNRAVDIKKILNSLEATTSICEFGKKEIEALKEEQYLLAREI